MCTMYAINIPRNKDTVFKYKYGSLKTPSNTFLSSGGRQRSGDNMEKIVIDVAESRIESLIRENFLTVEHVFTARTCLNLAAGAALGSAAGAAIGTVVVWTGSSVASKWKRWRETKAQDGQDRKHQVTVRINLLGTIQI